tara:strand:+ start:106 stop:264 length:159 start_codon:yes stop_codon:yes gene_type:complete
MTIQERNKMNKLIAKILRDMATAVADHLGEPAGMMFDMSGINELEALGDEEE